VAYVQFTIFPCSSKLKLFATRERARRDADVATPLSRTRKSRRGNVALRETRRVVSHRAQRDTKQATSVVLRPETQCRSFVRYRNRVDGLRNLAVSSPCAGARTQLAARIRADAGRWKKCSPGKGNDETICEIFFYSYTKKIASYRFPRLRNIKTKFS